MLQALLFHPAAPAMAMIQGIRGGPGYNPKGVFGILPTHRPPAPAKAPGPAEAVKKGDKDKGRSA